MACRKNIHGVASCLLIKQAIFLDPVANPFDSQLYCFAAILLFAPPTEPPTRLARVGRVSQGQQLPPRGTLISLSIWADLTLSATIETS